MWPGKYVIGLTGNIATGKSVVRKMLEYLGAFGIDADALSHRAIAKDAPGYRPILEIFGRWVLDPDGQIDRNRLARLVFTDPEALNRLEGIVHPLVNQAVDLIIRRAIQPVIVIEAIKLIETGMAKSCDSIWVTTASQEIQVRRMMQNRKMNEAEALMRIKAQPSQTEKFKAANIIIDNSGTVENTWKLVNDGFQKIQLPSSVFTKPVVPVSKGKLTVKRGSPRNFEDIVRLINRFSTDGHRKTREELSNALGEHAFMLLTLDDKLVGLVGWQVENLIARMTEIYIDPAIPAAEAISTLLIEVERASQDLQCEASLLFLPVNLARQESIWRNLGYECRNPQSLEVQAWQEAAQESMPDGSILFFKQLRQDRVLRPI
jgi:dephospho-CoA kinase